MSNLVRTLAFLLAIPVVGYLVAAGILWDLNGDAQRASGQTFEALCEVRAEINNADLNSACDEIASVQMLRTVSLWCALIGVALPLLAFLGARYAGNNRDRLASVFRPLVAVTVAVLAGLVLVEAGVLAFAAYEGESYLIGRVHFFIIGCVALGGLLGAFQLAASAFSFAKPVSFPVLGKRVTQDQAPQMFAEIEATARQIGARIPDNVVVGLDTTFFATSATVHLIGEQVPLQGETLFISAPLARILNREELASVIGHELGHFSGRDTAYSLRFAPVYAGLGSSLQAVSTADDEGALGLAKLPALALLGYVHGLFQESEAGVSRERELAADQSGAKAGSALALASALCKICVYSELWGKVQSQNVAALAEGQITRNLSRAFADSARYDVEAASADKLLEEVLDVRVAHPTDSHPPVSQRLDALQVSVAQVRDAGLSLPAQPAIELFESGGEELECSLTELHHRVLVAFGHVVIPDESQKDHTARAVYDLIACVIRADGKIEASEVLAAEKICERMLGSRFRSLDLRDVCTHQPEDYDPMPLARAFGASVTVENRETVIACLKALAEADGEIAPREAALIQGIEAAMKQGAEEAASTAASS
ncbi:M48 family metalloprotease [Steroidobacter cummioxidans]|uniref:M48 family metalloprotease n=1 Tax=Steroidobacter cummioxidans TaxID=1803913 RepID=UPI000E30E5B9|nr:M48 family metalloprotease [Steroidobacter cummioxidans]